MLFIVLPAYWYGPKTGILVGFTYGILQFLQEPYVLSLFQVCCDYFLAFAALGAAGFFAKSRNGLVKGYILGVFLRGVFHVLGGYLYWMDYMPDNFPQALAFAYPIIYNYSYLLAEGAITVILLSLPPVKKALEQVKPWRVKFSEELSGKEPDFSIPSGKLFFCFFKSLAIPSAQCYDKGYIRKSYEKVELHGLAGQALSIAGLYAPGVLWRKGL